MGFHFHWLDSVGKTFILSHLYIAINNFMMILGDASVDLYMINQLCDLFKILQLTGETVGEVRTVSDMHQRKAEMARQADAFIALPGMDFTHQSDILRVT